MALLVDRARPSKLAGVRLVFPFQLMSQKHRQTTADLALFGASYAFHLIDEIGKIELGKAMLAKQSG